MEGRFLQFVDVKTRLVLRRTCRSIRATCDSFSQYIKKLGYFYGDNFIEISTDNGFYVRYEFVNGGVLVRHEDNLNLVRARDENEKFEVIRTELMTIIRKERLRIRKLKIIENHGEKQNDLIPTFGMRVLRHTFDLLTNQSMRISKLKYVVLSLDENLIKVLEKMDPNHLESLLLSHDQENPYYTEVDEDIYKLEQWKKLKMVCMNHASSDMQDFIKNWIHLKMICLEFETLRDNTYDDLLKLKETLLQKSDFIFVQLILGNFTRAGVKRLKKTLKQQGKVRDGLIYFDCLFPNKELSVELNYDSIKFWGPEYSDESAKVFDSSEDEGESEEEETNDGDQDNN